MADRMTPEQRHRCMSRIRSRNTKPELKVRRWLWQHGYRYRLNVKSVPGSPDIVMRRYRTAIFVNGCFWHGHGVASPQVDSGEFRVESQLKAESSKCCKIPQTNREFWVNKIRRNQERDQQNYRVLWENGWQVIVVWECQLKPKRLEQTMLRVELLLNENLLRIYGCKPSGYSICREGDVPMVAEEQAEYGGRR
ncbi:MAG: very short patch repair endonuclease [Bacteroidales bacterium]|nr:very short patch repair endonuclease [Bacteroidales bacterium]